MKKRDIYFACLFIVCFLVSALVMAGDYFYKTLEKDWGSYQESFVQESSEKDQHQTGQERVPVQEEEPEGTESSEKVDQKA